MENNKKEPLNREYIERDIKKYYISMSIAHIVCAVVAAISFIFVKLILEITNKLSNNIAIYNISAIIFAVIILYYLCRFTFSICGYFSFKKKYRIQEDWLIDKGIRKSMRIGSGVIRSSHVLRFKKCGYFFGFATNKLYPWSENYSDVGYFELFDKSVPGEGFYLATVGKRIIAIYNKKMFELTESTEADNG